MFSAFDSCRSVRRSRLTGASRFRRLVRHDVHEERGRTIGGAGQGLTNREMGIVRAAEIRSCQTRLVVVTGLCSADARIVGVVGVIDHKVVVGRWGKRERCGIETHNAGSGGGRSHGANRGVAESNAWIGDAAERDRSGCGNRQASTGRGVHDHVADISLRSTRESEVENGGGTGDGKQSGTGNETKHRVIGPT